MKLPIVLLKKSINSDMHHCIPYMYINFQQNRVSISVKAVLTNLLAKIRKLHKFAITNRYLEKKNYFRHVSSYNRHVYQFSAKLR